MKTGIKDADRQKMIELAQDLFGFVENETKCADCGAILTRDNADWHAGSWWHKLVADCNEVKNEYL